jgi:hypothetical protein
MWRDEKIKVDIPDDAEVVFSSELARKNNYLIANEMKQSNNKEYILDNFH